MNALAEFVPFAAVLILGVLAIARIQPPRSHGRRSRDTGRRA